MNNLLTLKLLKVNSDVNEFFNIIIYIKIQGPESDERPMSSKCWKSSTYYIVIYITYLYSFWNINFARLTWIRSAGEMAVGWSM